LTVEHFGGKTEVSEARELEEVLKIRRFEGINEFVIFAKEEYPYMTFSVNGERACLHFFPEEGHPGFVSVGGGFAESGEEMTDFYLSPMEVVEIGSEFVVDIDTAYAAVKEFFSGYKRPACLEWFEL